ncbi:MAG: flavodoxin family protein [Clostridiales Family XIII bacterium]|jgi:multimeric flavodoxin WrbA|nr:flavodoxin family protein [Clostridiales Family XIII bacterium]
MKTLIIGGSPRKAGDTAALIGILRGQLPGEVAELSAYYSDISPCLDCRACRGTPGCVIRDDMDLIYADDFDAVVVASPIYFGNVTGPVLSLASRFQYTHSAREYLRAPVSYKPKRGGILLVGGGTGKGDEHGAIRAAMILMRMMNAEVRDDLIVVSRRTDVVPAAEDAAAAEKTRRLAQWLSEAE